MHHYEKSQAVTSFKDTYAYALKFHFIESSDEGFKFHDTTKILALVIDTVVFIGIGSTVVAILLFQILPLIG